MYKHFFKRLFDLIIALFAASYSNHGTIDLAD